MIQKTEINSKQTKTIALIRHGEPEVFSGISMFSIVKGIDIKKYIDSYNDCNTILPAAEPIYLEKTIQRGDCFITSNLKRTGQSLSYLGVHEFEINDLFNEAELPYGIFMNLRMPLFIWAFLLRAAWLSGDNRNCESIKNFKLRIKRAKEYLSERIVEKDNVIVMAHGLVNFTLGRELEKDKWELVGKVNGNKYWSLKKYSKVFS